MSKPMLVTVPFVLLLLDYWPLRRVSFPTSRYCITPSLRLILEKLPFFALAVASCALTYHWALHSGNTISAEEVPWGFRLANVPVSCARYLGKMIWPVDLAVLYPMASHWAWWQTGGAVVVLVLITLLVARRARSAPYLIVGWLIFLGMLVPTLRLAQAGFQSIADRYTYLPSIGLFIAVVWGGCELLKGLGSARRIGLSLAGLAGIVFCLGLTRQQLGYWKDSETLFRHALAVTEDNYVMHINLGTIFDRNGQIDEAIGQYQEALRLKPDDAFSHNNLGNALHKKGQIDEAIRQYEEALRLKPDDAHPHNNLGNALAQKGQIDKAIRQFQEALRLEPDYAEAHYHLGNALAQKGQLDEAILQFQEALRLKPGGADAHNNLGAALFRKGRTGEAIRQFQEALRLKPDYTNARKNLDVALAAQAASPQPPGNSN